MTNHPLPPAPVDIPSALTPREREVLRTLAAGQIVIEVGSLLGHATVAMGEVAAKVLAIDPHEGYPVDAPRPTLGAFITNLVQFGVRTNVVPILGRGQDILPVLKPFGFGLVFIDTMGDYEGTRELLRLAAALAPNVIAVHDYGRAAPQWDCSGVKEAVEGFVKMFAWTHYDTVDTLALLVPNG